MGLTSAAASGPWRTAWPLPASPGWWRWASSFLAFLSWSSWPSQPSQRAFLLLLLPSLLPGQAQDPSNSVGEKIHFVWNCFNKFHGGSLILHAEYSVHPTMLSWVMKLSCLPACLSAAASGVPAWLGWAQKPLTDTLSSPVWTRTLD